MRLAATAIGLSLLGGFGGLVAASGLLVLPTRLLDRLVPWLVSYAGVAGAGLALVFLEGLPMLEPYFLSFATSSFLYVAMSDLIPDLRRGTFDDNPVRQVLLVSAGIGTGVLL